MATDHEMKELQKAADCAGLELEFLELKRDAERYRWLKNNPQWLGWEHDFRPDEVEREIDAAMAAAPAVRAA